MSLREGLGNVSDAFRFHASVSGGMTWRFLYLAVYYAVFLLCRRGDRHARPLRWLKRLGLSDRLIRVVLPDGGRMKLDLHGAFDPLYQVYAARDYCLPPGFEPRPGQVVVDVGANVGTYALRMARLVGAAGRVAAIEPHPANHALLSDSARENGFHWLTAVQAAVSDAPGRAKLYIHPRAINYSLVRGSGECVEVDVTTLDALVERLGLPKIDILKVDVEGSEPAVLRGARGILERQRPLLAFERDDPGQAAETEEVLRTVRYRWRDIGAIRYAWPAESGPA